MNRKLLVAVVSGALALPMTAQAVEFSVSGHVGRVMVVMDSEGGSDDVANKDTGASPSRFRMTGSEELDSGVTAGVQLEYGAGDDGGSNPAVRHANVYLSGAFGKLVLGQQSRATDGIPYSNFDNIAWLGGVEVGCDYCDADFIQTYSGSRGEGVRYDTPNIGPATIAFSADGNDRWDAAVKLAGDTGAGGYQIKAGYTDDDGTRKTTISGAVGLAMGAHANVAWGKTNDDDSDYMNFGVGYNIGDSSIAATYYTSDIEGGGNSWAVGAGHNLGGGMEIFVSYKTVNYDDGINHERDRDGDKMKEDLMMDEEGLLVIGARVAFN